MRKNANTLVRRAVSLAAGAVVLGTFGCAYGSPPPVCEGDGGYRDPICPTLDEDAGASDAASDAASAAADAGADATK